MLIPLLSLALAVLPAAPASAMSGSRREEIARMASEWTSYRNSAHRMMTRFSADSARGGGDTAYVISQLGKLRVMLAQEENVRAATADLAREAIRASEPPSAARLERERAVAATHEAAALALYGHFVPKILDDSFKDRRGRPYGRDFCGPEWAIALTLDEANDYIRWQNSRAGFTEAQYDAFEDRARRDLGVPPAER